jgi:hypothetical protein
MQKNHSNVFIFIHVKYLTRQESSNKLIYMIIIFISIIGNEIATKNQKKETRKREKITFGKYCQTPCAQGDARLACGAQWQC